MGENGSDNDYDKDDDKTDYLAIIQVMYCSFNGTKSALVFLVYVFTG